MIRKKGQFLTLGIAVIFGISPLTAIAASPEFARTAEEWAKLEDNVLEYDEIADLIHEYNVTVQNNQYDYNKFLKDYGKTKEDVAQAYRDLANELETSLSGGSEASSKISDMQITQQAKSLRETADDNVEDSQIYYWAYTQAEDTLVLSAQSRFISYYRQLLELETAKEDLQLLNSKQQLAINQRSAGTATNMDVLDAQEAVQNKEISISEQEEEIESTRQKLVIMLGWKGSDQPEIQEVPAFDHQLLEQIDLEADKQTALETNYTLMTNKRKLDNSTDTDNREKLQKTISGNERQIGVSITSAWQNLQTSKLSYEQAIAGVETEGRNMTLAQQKWNAGMINRYELEQQEVTLSTQQRAVTIAELSLMESYATYKSAVNGLASAE